MMYYLHGYQSSPHGRKATLFKETLHAIPIAYRKNAPEDLVISHCLSRISEAIKMDGQVVLIGSSLGGFLAASTALAYPSVTQLILLNPAIIPLEQDLTTIIGMPQRILKDMKNPRLFKEKIPARITILRGTCDEVVPDEWIINFATAQHASIQLYNDDHQFSKNFNKLPKIISDLLQK